MIRIISIIILALFFTACSSVSGDKIASERTPSSVSSCQSTLQGVVIGYEFDDYGRSEKIETVDELTNDWSSTEFDFAVIPLDTYKKLSSKGKKGLELEFEIFRRDGKSTLNRKFAKWKKWPSKAKKGEELYMKLEGFSLREVFGRLVHPLYEKYNLKRRTRRKKNLTVNHLPNRMTLRLINKAKKETVCSHVINLNIDNY